MEGWKDGRRKVLKVEKMERWKNQKMEAWKDGSMEGWKEEGGKDGRMKG